MKEQDVDLLSEGDGLLGAGQEDLIQEQKDTDPHTNNLVKEFTRFREDPVESFKTLGKHVFGSSWRAYDDYIGQPLYYNGMVENVFEKTMDSSRIQECVDMLVNKAIERESKSRNFTPKDKEERVKELQNWLTKQAEDMVMKMVAKCHHKKVLQLMYYSVAQMFSRTYHQGVHVNADEIQMLKSKAKELQDKKQSLVFMPCHKSHIDYIAIQVICFRVGISLPAVVAGDNLNFAVIGPMLRQAGGMFIRRSFSEDPLYHSVVQAYIETILGNGYNFECFVEGTRSRIGKLLPPKFGILKYILEAIISGRVGDTWIVPVSTQYDKVAEAESYATELLGKEKSKESFADFLNASRILSLKMGRVDVRFKQPWSMKNYVLDQLSKITLETIEHLPLRSGLITGEVQTRLLRSLGYKILNDINEATVIMPTSMIGTVLLTSSGGLSFKELVAKVKRLIQMIHQAGGRVGTVSKESEQCMVFSNIEAMVLNGLKVLGTDLVGKEEKGLVEATYFAKDAFKLSYYRNQIIHLFVSEAIVTVAMYTVRRRSSTMYIEKSAVLDQVKFLSALLSSEFVYAAEGIAANFERTLLKLHEQRVVVIQDDGTLLLKFSTNELSSGEIFDFYCYVLWPFIDGYWLTSISLFTLVPEYDDNVTLWVEEREFLSVAQSLGKTLYHQGKLTYYEAVNKELLKGALGQLVAEGIVKRQASKDKKIPVKIALNKSWAPPRSIKNNELFKRGELVPSGKLYETSEAISECRHATLRHHDPTVTPKGTDLILLRACSALEKRYKSIQIVKDSKL